MFEGNAPAGHIRINSVIKALTTYGSEHLTMEQAHDLVSQVLSLFFFCTAIFEEQI